MVTEDKIRLFGMSHQMLERGLGTVERELAVKLEREGTQQIDRDETYYPQFTEAIRDEAAQMATHYEMFYCLENSIRGLVSDILRAAHGSNWWSIVVPASVQSNVSANIRREIDNGVTQRSTEEIDYT